VFHPITILIKYFLGYSLYIIVESEANIFLKGLNTLPDMLMHQFTHCPYKTDEERAQMMH
jgi:hypothetical protein